MDKVSLENYLDEVPVGNEEIVSCEGIVEAVGDVFRNIFHGSKKKFNPRDSSDVIRKLEQTYQNANWLSKRRFVTGEVTLRGEFDAGILSSNYKADIEKLKSEITAAGKTNIAIVDKLWKKIESVCKELDSGAWKNEDKCQELLPKVPAPEQPKYKDVAPRVFPKADVKLPALTKEEVVEVCKLVVDLIYVRVHAYPFEEWDNGLWIWVSGTMFPKWGKKSYGDYMADRHYGKGRTPEIVHKLFYAVDDFRAAAEIPYRDLEHMYEAPVTYMKALIHWIDASVK